MCTNGAIVQNRRSADIPTGSSSASIASVTVCRHERQTAPLRKLRADLLSRCHTSGFIFGVGKEGQPPQAAAISVAFARLSASLGLKGISHHTFRHTGATVMVANGVSLRAVQAIGG